MSETTIITVGAVVYVAILLVISIFASRNIKDSADFVVAGRRLPLWLCVFTIFATWFGSGTLIGAAGAAYSNGLMGVLANPFGSALCLLLAGLFYVRFLRRMQLLTLPDLFRKRFGQTAEILCAVCVIPAYVGWVASIFVAFGTVLHTVAGVNLVAAIGVGALITVAYTFAGGMWAVSLTDFVQALIIIAGLALLFPLVLSDIGGWDGLMKAAPEGHFNLIPEPTLFGWSMFCQGLLVIGLGNIASQDLLQRAFASKDERVAQWSMYLSTGLYLTVAMIPVLVGIAGAALMPDLATPETILPAMGKAYLHPVAMAIFVGALFAALMSSADGGLLAPASIVGRNLFGIFSGQLSERKILWGMRWSILVMGVFALVIALAFQNVYQLMIKSFSILMVGLFVPMTGAIYWPRANSPGAIASIIAGVSTWLGLERLNAIDGVHLPAELIAAGVSLIALILVTWGTSKRVPALPPTDLDGHPLEYDKRLGVLSPRAPRS
jgi:SSS family transporter